MHDVLNARIAFTVCSFILQVLHSHCNHSYINRFNVYDGGDNHS